MAHLEAIHSEFGDRIDLRLDFNQALQPINALRILRVDRFSPTFIEQPLPRHILDAMASYAAALDTPILADESCFDSFDLIHPPQGGGCDLDQAHEGRWPVEGTGHLCNCRHRRFAGIWRNTLGRRLGPRRRNPAVAATPGISLGCEFYMPHWVLTEDVLEEKVPNDGGHVVVPDRPALGIRVSEQSVRANARILAKR